MKESKTLAELQAEASASEGSGFQIAGRSAEVCPYCGCGMLAYRTDTWQTQVRRYVRCRNSNCGKKFEAQQPKGELVREIGNNLSSSGKSSLTVFRESA